MIGKKAIAFEQLVKMILALLVLAVIIGVFYILMRPSIDNMLGIEKTNAEEGGHVIDSLSNLFGRGCDNGARCCNPLSHKERVCEDGKWVTSDIECPDSLDTC